MDRWKQQLDRLAQSCGNRDPGDVIDDLCELARAMGDDAAERLLDAYPGLFEYAPVLTRAFYQRVVNKEIAENRRLLKEIRNGPVAFPDVTSAATLRSYNRVRGMFDHLDLAGCRRFVMVGCGWLPETLFHVQDRTQIPEIVGLDLLPEAVEAANGLAERLGYSRVRVELCDGCLYDYGCAPIIFVTNMVSRKSEILSRIADTAPENVQIVVREAYSLRRLWSERATSPLDPRLEISGLGRGNPTLARDVYLRRPQPTVPASASIPD